RIGDLTNIYKLIGDYCYTEYPTLLGTNSIPMSFIPFNTEDLNCFYCEDEYAQVGYNRKYCRKCLSSYVVDIKNNGNDTMKLKSSEHEINNNEYSITYGCIESTLTIQPAPILYLPWWDNNTSCIACHHFKLKFISDCQKYCTQCGVIYIGCRDCLTTNIIFGFSDQSRCKKCGRISLINDDLHDFTVINLYTSNYLQLAKVVDGVNKTGNLTNIYGLTRNYLYTEYPTLLGTNSMPIMFIPFNKKDLNCFYCEDEYAQVGYNRKYCKKCLSNYIFNINNNKNVINNLKTSEHEFI